MSLGTWRDGWFVVPHQVIFRDVDYFGHVNNAVYLTYFELARTELWFALTGGRVPLDINFIVAHARVDFRLQIAMEPIEIAVRISEMRTTSLDFVYEIRKNGGVELAATGIVTVVLFDWDTRTKRPITEELRRKVEEFQVCSRDAF
ncbi:MAG TPA: thioesterase family protein [Thermoanaerobaculia bacterium]